MAWVLACPSQNRPQSLVFLNVQSPFSYCPYDGLTKPTLFTSVPLVSGDLTDIDPPRRAIAEITQTLSFFSACLRNAKEPFPSFSFFLVLASQLLPFSLTLSQFQVFTCFSVSWFFTSNLVSSLHSLSLALLQNIHFDVLFSHNTKRLQNEAAIISILWKPLGLTAPLFPPPLCLKGMRDFQLPWVRDFVLFTAYPVYPQRLALCFPRRSDSMNSCWVTLKGWFSLGEPDRILMPMWKPHIRNAHHGENGISISVDLYLAKHLKDAVEPF